MRRTLALPLAALGLVASLLSASASYADGDPLVLPTLPERAAEPVAPTAHEVLDRAAATLGGERFEGGRAGPVRPEATLAMRDLFASLPRLGSADRERAESLLARPTQRRNDPYGDGYSAKAVKTCSKRLCVHRVKRTSDRATAAWARRTLKVMGRVWKREVGRMGYRRPLKDGRRGGNPRFDVYLADVGARGLFGYCAPEFTKPGNKRLASGYCVLDNDFARSQFNARPVSSLKVTGAHEFFHAVQFAYDYLEDPWLMEATSTWIEERFADGANDNRRYLPFGQVRRPWEPLDYYNANGNNQYGNWAFFEYLSQRFAPKLVKRVWKQAGQAGDDGKKYSTQAVRAVLARRAPFKQVHADFQAANVLPARAYPEGEHWPKAQLADNRALGRNQGVTTDASIDHMAGLDFRMTPKAGLDERSWGLRVIVDGPAAKTSPMVTLVRRTAADKIRRTRVRLDETGVGRASVPFNRVQTEAVWVVVTNASTRFGCRGPYKLGYSCGGNPQDDDKSFDLTFETYSKG